MTITTNTSRVAYVAGGTSPDFATTFVFYAAAHLEVFLNGALQLLTTHYTVTGAGNPTGGTVTFVTTPLAGASVVIRRVVPLTQETAYPSNSPFPASTHERGLDLQTQVTQQLAEVDARSLKVGSASLFADLGVPDPEAGKLMRWNSGQTALENVTLAQLGSGSVTLPLAIADGGTNATTAAAARTQLGVDGLVRRALTNRTGATGAAGDVVALSAANDTSVILGDTVSSKATFVVGLDAPANLASGEYALSGVATVKNQGAVTRGNYLRKSATTLRCEDTGTAATAANDPPAGSFAIALVSNAGTGTITALLLGMTHAGTPTVVLPVGAAFSGLRVFTDPDDPTQRMRVLCDSAILVDASGTPKRFTGINVMADIGSAAGAGAIDTGTVTANTEYDLYVIGQTGGTVSAVFSRGKQWTIDQSYADSNRDAAIALRDAAARTQVAQGFQLAANGLVHSIDVSLLKVGAPTGRIWAEIQTNNAGVPSNTMVAGGRGMLLPITHMDATSRVRMRLVFPERPSLVTGTQYHLVLKGDFSIGAAHVTVGVDATAPTYANGGFATFDGAAWAADATRDMALFIVNTLTGTESVTMPGGYTFLGRVSWNKADGSSALQPMWQTGHRWTLAQNLVLDTVASATVWAAIDFSARAPAAWVDNYCLVWRGFSSGHSSLATPLPLGVPLAAANGQVWFDSASPYASETEQQSTDVPGYVGPMCWHQSNVAGENVWLRHFELAL
jgi:hypothetical protein